MASYFAASPVCWCFLYHKVGDLQLENEMILSCSFAFVFEALGDQIIFVNRPDKKKILFYNDKSCHFAVDEGRCCFTCFSMTAGLNSS